MIRIIYLDNDTGWHDKVREKLEEAILKDRIVFEYATKKDDFFHKLENQTFETHYDLVLLDLELQGSDGTNQPMDMDGRDIVLPRLREEYPWLPVILFSSYVKAGDESVIAQVSPFSFDAIIGKSYLSLSKINEVQWLDLFDNAHINRMSCLTGRPFNRVLNNFQNQINLKAGQKIENLFKRLDEKNVKTLFSFLGLPTKEILFEEIVSGFSGLHVLKGTVQIAGDETHWLFKFGDDIKKLNEEISAHRSLFTTGFTRRLSVPPLWWSVVSWRGLGLIAYEFENDADTGLNACKIKGHLDLSNQISDCLGELYRHSEIRSVIPRNEIARHSSSFFESETKLGQGIKTLTSGKDLAAVDDPVKLRVGSIHGDFHARNILVSKHGPTIIDFANYKKPDKGFPCIIDLSKLLVDLAVWKSFDKGFDSLISGTILDESDLQGIIKHYLCDGDGGASDNEKFVFSLFCISYLRKYLGYDDVPKKVKAEIKKAIKEFSISQE